jgi:hypothetical protein
MQVLIHPSDQPIFRLTGSFAQCRIEIRLNDVPLLRDVTGEAQSFDIPVNEWLFQGANPLQIHLHPLENGAALSKGATLDLCWAHKLSREPAHQLTELGEVHWQPDTSPTHEHAGHTHALAGAATDHMHEEEDDLEDSVPLLAIPGQLESMACGFRPPTSLPDKSILITSRLPLPPPWPVCPWARSAALPDNGGTHHAISGMIRTLHHSLRLGGWEQPLKTRRAAIMAAYYLGSDEVDAALGFPPLLKAPEWQLDPLPETPLKLEIAGGGRLARLINPATGETPLILTSSKARLTAAINAWWLFAGEWLLVR